MLHLIAGDMALAVTTPFDTTLFNTISVTTTYDGAA